MQNPMSGEITRVVLLVLIIALLLAGSLWTLLPFLGALVWAASIVVATWPLLAWIERHVGGRRGAAVAIMTILILLCFIVPLALAVSTLLDAAGRSPALVHDFAVRGLGPPPAWLANVPVVGERAAEQWLRISQQGPEALAEFVRPYVRDAASWIVAATGSLGMLLLQVLLMVILIAILYSQGEVAGRGMLAFGRRIGGQRGEQTIVLAQQAVRSVALGIVVTALVQSLLAGIGLWICGVPHAGVLTAAAFVLGIAQLGPLPILIPCIAWLYWSGNATWGTVLLVWSIPVGVLDNFLRPVLIRRGVQLPMLLIIAGVIGGLVGFGVLGLFVGPVILAAAYTLTLAWIHEGDSRTAAEMDA